MFAILKIRKQRNENRKMSHNRYYRAYELKKLAIDARLISENEEPSNFLKIGLINTFNHASYSYPEIPVEAVLAHKRVRLYKYAKAHNINIDDIQQSDTTYQRIVQMEHNTVLDFCKEIHVPFETMGKNGGLEPSGEHYGKARFHLALNDYDTYVALQNLHKSDTLYACLYGPPEEQYLHELMRKKGLE